MEEFGRWSDLGVDCCGWFDELGIDGGRGIRVYGERGRSKEWEEVDWYGLGMHVVYGCGWTPLFAEDVDIAMRFLLDFGDRTTLVCPIWDCDMLCTSQSLHHNSTATFLLFTNPNDGYQYRDDDRENSSQMKE